MAVPVLTPVTTAPNDTVATAGLLLVHDTPPPVASVKNDVEPTHTVSIPPIGDGAGLIVTTFVTKQPAPDV